MIYKATKLIEQEIKKNDLKYDIREFESFSSVQIKFVEDNLRISMHFISRDNDNDVKLMTEDIVKFPEEKLQAAFALVNDLNSEYRYIKFVIDTEDGGMRMQYDFPVNLEDSEVGPVAMELVARTVKIAKDAYPKLMKCIWA